MPYGVSSILSSMMLRWHSQWYQKHKNSPLGRCSVGVRQRGPCRPCRSLTRLACTGWCSSFPLPVDCGHWNDSPQVTLGHLSGTGHPQPLIITTITTKSLQSCPTLCNPIDGSPPGSPVPGILQARTLAKYKSFQGTPVWEKQLL